MNAFSLLLHSPAFWTALISVIGLTVLKYALLPEDIWNGLAALLAVVVTVLTADGAAKALGRHMIEGNREMIIDLRKQEKEHMLSREDKG
jgi:hypothetical protein